MASPPTVYNTSSITPLPSGNFYALPVDLAAHRTKLMGIADSVAQFDKVMDGYFFGIVGADGVVSLIPWVGDTLSGLTTFWLISKASEAKMPVGDIVMIAGLGSLDVAIGFIPFAGDAADLFFRAHAWNGARICHHINVQIEKIDDVERSLTKSVPVANHRESLEHLRDSVFRSGRTTRQVWIRFGIVAAACLTLVGYCSHQASLRQERVLACQASRGWFCEWRY